MSCLQNDDQKPQKFPLTELTTRVTTLVTLAISMAILKTNTVVYTIASTLVIFDCSDVYTYRYVFYGMAAGFCYTLLQVPFLFYFFFRKKTFVGKNAFLVFRFYGDKICMSLLAITVGSLVGATIETKKNAYEIVAFGDDSDLRDYHAKINNFCKMAYVASIFLLIAFVLTMISSIMPSRALANKT